MSSVLVIGYAVEVLGKLLNAHPSFRTELQNRPAKNSFERDLQLFMGQLLNCTIVGLLHE